MHIVDYGILYGLQWPGLISALVNPRILYDYLVLRYMCARNGFIEVGNDLGGISYGLGCYIVVLTQTSQTLVSRIYLVSMPNAYTAHNIVVVIGLGVGCHGYNVCDTLTIIYFLL